MTRAVLELQELTAGYADNAIVHGINLVLNEREIAVLVGPNGAGKSTVLKAVFGPVSYTHLTLPTKRIV